MTADMVFMATEEYYEYINGDAWKRKRAQRLGISKFQCAACGSKDRIEVHHLTYARLFNEAMEDLLPLCFYHHKAAEELVATGHLLRTGDPLFLATETIRLLMPFGSKKKNGREMETSDNKKIKVNNRGQERLMSEEWFLEALKLTRNQFKARVHEYIAHMPQKGSLMSNACALFDRQFRRRNH